MFKCDCCGECCRNLDKSDLYKELNRGDGVNFSWKIYVPFMTTGLYYVELMILMIFILKIDIQRKSITN